VIQTLSVDGRLLCQDRPELYSAPDDERKGSRAYKRRVNAARALCYRCPVMVACRRQGRERRESGVWGAEDDVQREQAGSKPRRRVPSGQDLRGTRLPTSA
jgi:hypothetical protein